MRQAQAVRRGPPARGFTLVELLVALAIGLVLAGAFTVTYLGSLRGLRTSMAVAQMTEDGQAGLAFIIQQLRQAGYNPRPPGAAAPRDLMTGGVTLFGCGAGFDAVSAAPAALRCKPGAGRPGAIAVSYLADGYNTLLTSDGRPTDCIGSGIRPTPGGPGEAGGYHVAHNRIYVANGSLMCAGSGGSAPFTNPQPFVENVEDLRFSYGVSADGDGPAAAALAGYLGAEQLGPLAGAGGASGDTAFDALDAARRWGRVGSVRVCLVLRSADAVLESGDASPSPSRYADCDGVVTTIRDGRLRRAFSATVVLRNRGDAS